MIFGFLGKFCIDIGEKFFRKMFFRDEKSFSEKFSKKFFSEKWSLRRKIIISQNVDVCDIFIIFKNAEIFEMFIILKIFKIFEMFDFFWIFCSSIARCYKHYAWIPGEPHRDGEGKSIKFIEIVFKNQNFQIFENLENFQNDENFENLDILGNYKKKYTSKKL